MSSQSSQKRFAIYGANGYTGRLVVEEAVRRGHRPIISGRNAEAIEKLGNKYDLPTQICSLDNNDQLDDLLLSVDLVLHCAGPFSQTYRQMVAACLRNQTHYLDIDGEIDIIESLAAMDRQAKDADIMIMPCVGFDVVPTDCLALFLKEQLPSANSLQLAFIGIGSGLSHGTASTTIERLGWGGLVRRNGKITKVPTAHNVKNIPFTKHKSYDAVAMPWGDVATAYYTTGIPNIESYIGLPQAVIKILQATDPLGKLIDNKLVKGMLQKLVDKTIDGPSKKQRNRSKTYVWGQVSDEMGQSVAARLQTPEAYKLTAQSAVHIVGKVLADNYATGFQTPAGMYGADLILELPDTSRQIIDKKTVIAS